MQIIIKKLTEIRPYENNPRKNDKSVEAVAKSIRTFGFRVPVVIDSDGVIVAGHTRYKASEKLGLTEIPCVVADDLTEEQVRAFRLADNKTAELSDWDFDLLDSELDSITDIDMTDFGFPDKNDVQFFDFMANDDFINNNSDNKKTFDFTLEIPAEYKPAFNLYVKKFGKSRILQIVKDEVLENA
ncbi:MAG: ParB N-terminal domain-containing protein [Ruminococcus sp.]|nr:ParB N-terminal domain-containing protein [Ruminococcus sp.]